METIPYVVPFCLYVIPSLFESSDSQSASYLLVCTLKGVLALAALVIYRRSYPRFSTKGFSLAIVAGVIGFAIWIGLDQIQSQVPLLGEWFRHVQGQRAGFNPFISGSPSTAYLAFIAVRLVELTVVVPLAEEVFWRGFLARYLVSEDFESVPQGQFSVTSFIVVTLMFTSVHPEILAALAWGCLVNLLYMRTMNLWACVLMHSVTNGMLGAYILVTQAWYLW